MAVAAQTQNLDQYRTVDATGFATWNLKEMNNAQRGAVKISEEGNAKTSRFTAIAWGVGLAAGSALMFSVASAVSMYVADFFLITVLMITGLEIPFLTFLFILVTSDLVAFAATYAAAFFIGKAVLWNPITTKIEQNWDTAAKHDLQSQTAFVMSKQEAPAHAHA